MQLKIKENLRKCYDAGSSQAAADLNTMRGLSFFKPDQRCSSAAGRYRNPFSSASTSGVGGADYSQIGDDFCSSADNGLYPIGGQIPAIARAILEFDAPLYFDALDVWSDPLATTLLLKSTHRDELRYFHVKHGNDEAPVLFRTLNLAQLTTQQATMKSGVSKVPAVSGMQLETTSGGGEGQPNLFVLSGANQLLKLRMSACESLKTCGECLTSADPYCGWCASASQCTTQTMCDIKWLNGAQLKLHNQANLIDSTCVDIASVEPAVTHKGNTDWIEITFRKDLQHQNNDKNNKENDTSFECIFLAPDGSDNLRTEAVQVLTSKLKCPLPHLSQMQGK